MESEENYLGRTAYEAYCETTGWKSAVTGVDLPKFYDTPAAVQAGWIAAARSVAGIRVSICRNCEYQYSEGCRVKGLGVTGIAQCVKFQALPKVDAE